VLFIREIDPDKSVNILAILSDKEGSRIIHFTAKVMKIMDSELKLTEAYIVYGVQLLMLK
jgi:hypothetical protein